MYNYNRFHKKNNQIQTKVIKRENYVYQTLIELCGKYFSNVKHQIIDLGCGVGTFDFFLADQGYKVIGVDISDRAITFANSSKHALNINNINFERHDLLTYKFQRTYLYVICSEVIEHLKDDKYFLSNIHLNMKKNGLLILSTPLISAPLNKMGLLTKFDSKVGHLRRYDRDNLTKMLLDIGFEIIEIKEVEGILRNFMFTNEKFGFLIRFIRWPVTIIVNFFDNILRVLFGASNIYYVLKKIK